ncbi:MAG: hypothetical protein HeimC2_29190 [Candidatus Heimdallarchaeota archaeon LC_2]|nr:MAG: hypothetical protein HeimC2_29190 [Candidatus Heimdallarchaeota archaeon LC_2]
MTSVVTQTNLEERAISFIEKLLKISNPIEVKIEEPLVILYYQNWDSSKEQTVEHYDDKDYFIIIRKQNKKIRLVEIIGTSQIP